MSTRSSVQRMLVATLAMLGAVVIGAGVWSAAAAEVTGGCTATVNGQDMDGAHSASSAVSVPASGTATVVGTAPGPIDSYSVYMKFGPFRFEAASGEVTSGDTSYQEIVNVDDYATYGVGLYRVEGETSGTECTVWGYVKVTGKSPLTTVAGATATVATVGGGIGMISSYPRKPRPRRA